MALDWSKNISFSGLKKAVPKGRVAYPSKTFMNLVVQDKKALEVRQAVPVGVLLLVLVFAFVKFGVYDFYDRVFQKQAELAEVQQAYSKLQMQLVDYDVVLDEYESYESAALGSGSMPVSALESLALVDTYIRPSATVTSVSLQKGTISLNLSNITLDGVGRLVSTLYDQPIVANVSVSTAATGQSTSTDAVASMVITLVGAGDEQ